MQPTDLALEDFVDGLGFAEAPRWHAGVFVHETNQWLVFPHELEGHDHEELRAARGESFLAALRGQR